MRHFLPNCPEEVRMDHRERGRANGMRFDESDVQTLMERLKKIESQNATGLARMELLRACDS